MPAALNGWNANTPRRFPILQMTAAHCAFRAGEAVGAGVHLTTRRDTPILSSMVNYQARLDRTFAALVDPTRRAILAHLERKVSASVSELAEPFSIKLPAVMKHLDVLADAGLISRVKSGRTVTVKLQPRPMREAMAWLARYERFWTGSLDRLVGHAERKEAEARSAAR
jgi:DNA-binding transcriptional ArsR family regulator